MPTSHRIGHGYDIHRLQMRGRLVLGGVVVAEEISAIAHSDGDVVVHAVVDALLGALARGDIGQRFPNTDPRWAGASSLRFLDDVYAELRRDGWSIVNLDVTVLAEHPRLASHRAAIIETLSAHLGGAQVSLKAGTNEGCDAIGRGEAIAAHAVVLLAKESDRP